MTLTPEVKNELLAMLRAELAQEEQRRQDNKTVYRRACKDLGDRLAEFDFNGCRMDWKIRDAIGTLLRAVYQVNAVAKLPAEREPEIREFVESVLHLMKDQKREAMQ